MAVRSAELGQLEAAAPTHDTAAVRRNSSLSNPIMTNSLTKVFYLLRDEQRWTACGTSKSPRIRAILRIILLLTLFDKYVNLMKSHMLILSW